MKISFERNTEQNSDTIPYFVRIEIGASELDWDRTFRVPVILSHGLMYIVEICGLQIKAETLKALGPLVQSKLISLENLSRMPTYVFITRRSRKLFPVYTIGDKVMAVTPQGISFRHVELAKVREYLKDYLHQVGLLGPIERGDRLHVRGVHKKTLALIRPVFYLKKRAMNEREHEFWAPVFRATDSDSIYAYAASTKHEAQLQQGLEVFRLRQKVAEALIQDQRLTTNLNLRADRLMPDYWERLKNNLVKLERDMAYEGIKLPMYKSENVLIALEYRSAEDRYSLFLGQDDDDLCRRVSNDLIRRGYIEDPRSVFIQGKS